MSKKNPRVLVATDFSPGSDAALRGLEALWPKGAHLRIHLVHVIEPLVVVTAPTAYWTGFEEERTEDARRALRRVGTRLQKRLGPAVKIQMSLPMGPVHAEICDLAAKLKVDLIVVGTHGRTGFRHTLIGSVAERVVRHAGRPVLTIPLAPGRAARKAT